MIGSASLYQEQLLIWWELGRILTNQKLYLTVPSHMKVGVPHLSFLPLTQSRTLQICCRAGAASWPTNGRWAGRTSWRLQECHDTSCFTELCLSIIDIQISFVVVLSSLYIFPLILYTSPQYYPQIPNLAASRHNSFSPLSKDLHTQFNRVSDRAR